MKNILVLVAAAVAGAYAQKKFGVIDQVKTQLGRLIKRDIIS